MYTIQLGLSLQYTLPLTQQTRDVQPMLVYCIIFIQCWPSVFDAGPTLYKYYTNVLCLLSYKHSMFARVVMMAFRGWPLSSLTGCGWRRIQCTHWFTDEQWQSDLGSYSRTRWPSRPIRSLRYIVHHSHHANHTKLSPFTDDFFIYM